MGKSSSSLLRSSVSRSRFSAFFSQTLVLYLLGMMAYGLWQATIWVKNLHENIEIQVFLSEDVSPAEVRSMIKDLRQFEQVKQVDYVSKAEAAKEMSRDLGEDFVDFLGENPLMSSLKVKMNFEYGQKNDFKALVVRLRTFPKVSEVVYPQRLLTSLQQNIRTMAVVLSVLSAILLGVTWMLVDQSVRLAIFADRNLIRSMQLVGAEDAFIRRPYLKSALKGSALSLLFSLGGIVLTSFWISQWASDFQNVVHPVLFWMAAGLAFFAFFVGWLSHYAALNKYLRLDYDQLY
jgi:cell division transport system permease protein